MAKRKQPKDPRRQHWVPRFYLDYFATPESRDTEEPLVWAFSKEAGDPILISSRQVAAKNFLYSPKDQVGKRSPAMEKKLESLEAF